MPVRTGENRGYLLTGLAVLVAVVLLGYLSTLKESGDGTPSSYSARKKGGKAAYLFLLQNGYPVSRWEQSPKQLSQNAQGTTLIVADPERWPDADEQLAISRFVNAGGKILITGAWINSLRLPSETESGVQRVGHAECKPVAPTTLTRAAEITQDENLFWSKDAIAHVVHYTDEKGRAVVVSYKQGKGEVIWWASALPLTNVGIREKHNLELLLASVGDSQSILWDEYYHKAAIETARQSHRYAQVMRWGWWQLVAFAIVLVLTYSRRSGPIVPAIKPSRLSPLEFVQTMGSVFYKAGASQVAVEIAFGRLRQVASRRLGLRGDADADDISSSMLQRNFGMSAELANGLQEAQAAMDDIGLREATAIKHVRIINRVLALLERDRAV